MRLGTGRFRSEVFDMGDIEMGDVEMGNIGIGKVFGRMFDAFG